MRLTAHLEFSYEVSDNDIQEAYQTTNPFECADIDYGQALDIGIGVFISLLEGRDDPKHKISFWVAPETPEDHTHGSTLQRVILHDGEGSRLNE